MKYTITIAAFLFCLSIFGQGQKKRTLFLGNSYTNVNDLPQLVADVATSAGDTLIVDSNTPGGYTLQQHSTNSTSLSKIAAGNWDFVVLQEQSQLPSFPDGDVETYVFPYAKILDSIINANDPCAETVFYMTWGRKNGDASNCSSWPPVCSYVGMDSLLALRYKMMADSNHAIVSPVGAVWKYLRQNFPSIELYQSDESHPSVAGSYAAACSFYTAIFRKDPTLISFNSSLSAGDAAIIRNAAKLIVYDNLMNWNIGEFDPSANYTFSFSAPGHVSFVNGSANAMNYSWDLGDGTTSSGSDPAHDYTSIGSYTVTLVAEKCGMFDTISQVITVTALGITSEKNELTLNVFPNPATTILEIYSAYSNDLAFRIFNSIGAEVKTGIINKQENKIGISELSNGIYFLKLRSSSGSQASERFVKDSK
jgi:hypothetical protein